MTDYSKEIESRKDELIAFLKDEYERMDKDFQARVKSFESRYKQFRGILPEEQKSIYKSHLFINKTKTAIVGGWSNLVDLLFPSTDFFSTAGRTQLDQEGAAITKKMMTWLTDLGKFELESIKYILQAAIYGTTFGKIVREEKVFVSVDKLPMLNWVRKITGFKSGIIKKVVTYPALRTVSIFDVRIDPLATTIEEASGLFHQFERSLSHVKEKMEDGTYDKSKMDEVEKLIDKKTNDEDKRRKAVGLPAVDKAPETLQLYEYWGRIPVEAAELYKIKVDPNESEIEAIITTVDNSVVIRAERNTNPAQERMWVVDRWEESGEQSIYGRGIAENVRGSQMALNATINLRLDNKAWAIAKPIVINNEFLVDANDLVAKPNWIIRVNGKPDDILKFEDIPDMTMNSHAEADFFARVMQDESGIGPEVEGGPYGSNRTLGGISIAVSSASRPLRLIAKGFEHNLIARGLKLIHMNFISDLDEEIVVRAIDNPNAISFLTLDPVKVGLDIDFVAKGTFGMVSREAIASNITQFAQAVAQIAQVDQTIVQKINWDFFLKKFYESLFGSNDWDQAWAAGGNALGQPPSIPGVTLPGAGGSNPASAQPAGAAGMGGLEEIAGALAPPAR